MLVTNIDEALRLVRERYPTAFREGSTFDWSFWVGDTYRQRKVVAVAIMNRRAKLNKWELTIFDTPREL